MFFSVHEGAGQYPGTGLTSQGNALNVPLQPGMGMWEMLAAVRDVLRPAAETFAPELVIVSAGFDAHFHDPLGALSASTEGFAALCAEVQQIAGATGHGRLALVWRGGTT